jgi:hypothetical protein
MTCWGLVGQRGCGEARIALWYCPRDILRVPIRGVVTFAALARSPVSGDAA